MSTPAPAPTPTWLCTFLVYVDFPVTTSVADMESAVAFGIVQYLKSIKFPGNASAVLTATQGNATVANPGPTPIGSNPTPTPTPGALA